MKKSRFSDSQSCYRYEAKADAENEEIANWLLKLTDNHRNWGFGLYSLYEWAGTTSGLPDIPATGIEPAPQATQAPGTQ